VDEKQNKENKKSQLDIVTKKTNVVLFAISFVASSFKQNDI
jgi:hypothetical protein